MSYITTYTGKDFDPLNPRSELVDIRDIAHALSLLCRANGHFVSFYSVGQHCINCALEAKARGYAMRLQLACLLHDAAEAYMADVTRPVKQMLEEYTTAEDRLLKVIYRKFLPEMLSAEEMQAVKAIDDDLLLFEFSRLMKRDVFDRTAELMSQPQTGFVPFAEIEEKYIEMFYKLGGQ